MRVSIRLSILGLAGLLGSCAAAPGERPAVAPGEPPPEPLSEWETRLTPDDAHRLAALPTLWSRALAAARPRFTSALAKEGTVLEPGRRLSYPALPPGAYHCRVLKVGASALRQPAYRAFPTALCFVGAEKDAQSFSRQGGTERPGGWLYPDGDARLIFIGAYGGTAPTPPPYGAAGARNAIGVVERIAHFRWRLTLLPASDTEQLTVYDLKPVPSEAQLPATP